MNLLKPLILKGEIMSELIKKIPAIDGEFLTYPSGEGCELYLLKGVGFEAFTTYCMKLGQSGFSCVNKNKIENNFFEFYKKENVIVCVGYYDCDKTMRIVVDEKTDFPEFVQRKVTKKTDSVFWQFEVDHSLIDCGMCYILKLSSGAFFIIDSAHTYSINDCERIHKFLRERTPENEKIHIAGWFFSHAHDDHIAQFISYLNFYCYDTVIDALYYNFISSDHRDGTDWMETHRGYVALFNNALENHPEIPVIRLHTGQTFYIDNLKVDVLCSHEDVFPNDNSNFNDSSVVLMLTLEKTKILIPGDAGHEESYILEARYPEYLKSDIVQSAHHGHFGTTEDFYRLVKANVVLFPVTQIMFDGDFDRYPANKVAIDLADEYHIASNGTVEIPLPFKKGNLKVYPDETFESFKGVFDLWTYTYTPEYKEKLYKEYLARGGKPLDEYKDGF